MKSIRLWAANYVEVTVEIDSTWRSSISTNHHHATGKCIVGAYDWFITGDFLKNAVVDYWRLGTNTIERRLITSREKNSGAGPGIAPDTGDISIIVHPTPRGEPAFHTVEGTLWLAFCSASYLKQDGRQIPMMIGPSSEGFGYSDKTTVFDSDIGLPKSVELYGIDGILACKYEVLETTNVFGRTLPLRYHVFQHGQSHHGRVLLESTSELFGRVTSITPCSQPEIPISVRKKLEEQDF
jgi:hypothetical protein